MVKYFLSGASGIRAAVLPEVAALVDYRLLSMHKAFKGNTKVWCEISNHPKSAMKEVMLDSGAFTAFMKGDQVTLDGLIASYDDTLRRLNPKLQVWMINLDVIPGTPGKVAEPAEIQSALDESDRNFKLLRKRYGARVLPVYHQTEGERRLRQVASMSDFISLSFRQDFAESDRIRHAEEALSIVKPMGKKVHGLATTGYKMLSRTNFDTVDSATWLYVAAMGGVMFIDSRGEIASTAVSSSSPRQSEIRGHYNSLHPDEQKLIRSRSADAGVSIEQLSTDLSYRILFNAHQLREWLRAHKTPVIVAETGLFPL